MAEPTSSSTHEPTDGASLPILSSPYSAPEIVARLDALARRGKLPGFQRTPNQPTLFEMTDFGTPFESVLAATATPSAVGTDLAFQSRMKRGTLWVFNIALIVSVWPGVWLTDSMIRTYFPSYPLSFGGTCAWYLPLTILPAPLALLSALRRSRTTAHAEALSLITSIANAIHAADSIAPPAPDTA